MPFVELKDILVLYLFLNLKNKAYLHDYGDYRITSVNVMRYDVVTLPTLFNESDWANEHDQVVNERV